MEAWQLHATASNVKLCSDSLAASCLRKRKNSTLRGGSLATPCHGLQTANSAVISTRLHAFHFAMGLRRLHASTLRVVGGRENLLRSHLTETQRPLKPKWPRTRLDRRCRTRSGMHAYAQLWSQHPLSLCCVYPIPGFFVVCLPNSKVLCVVFKTCVILFMCMSLK